MLDAAVKAIVQMFSPPLRAVLWKSVALALALIVVVAIALYRLIVWLVGTGSISAETRSGLMRTGRWKPLPGCFRLPPVSASSSAASCSCRR